jgi:hypothetical protein
MQGVTSFIKDDSTYKADSDHIGVPVHQLHGTLPESKPFLRHDGVPRPSSALSDSFIFILLFIFILFLNKILKKGPRLLFETLRSIWSIDERSITRDSVYRRNIPFFVLLNISIIALTAKTYLLHYVETKNTDVWFYWKLLLYTAVFWLIKFLLNQFMVVVFFSREGIKRWFIANQVLISVFSLTLVPLLILIEIGISIPFFVFYGWPVLFLIIPKIVYTFRSSNFFLMENRGYFYMILYLCALEILPILLFVKGLFFIQ